MGLFGKKKLDEEEFDPTSPEASRGRVRDLRPENRKLRKEPSKPWGKFERMVVLIFLLLTVFGSLMLMMYSKGYKLPKIDLDLSKFNFFGKETIIIE